ncbi:MAG: substrate-binding domain-containing protein [Caldilineaceae bacterium]
MMRKNITRRTFLKGLAVTSLGAASAQIMTACAPAAPAGGGAQDAAGSSSAPAATDVVLRVQVPPEGGQSVMPTMFAEQYTADSGVQVEIEETIYGEIETKTQTGFISGTLQDLLYGHHRWLFINYLKGIYLEIDDLLASDPPEDYADIYPSVMAGNALNGKNFSVPGVVHPGGNIAVMFNKTMLEEKGLPLPEEGWNFQQWTELAKAAADPDNGSFGLSFDGMNSFHYYSNTSRSWGSPDSNDSWVMNADGTALTFNTPLHEELGAWYLDLLDSKVAPRKADYIENSASRLFIAGLNATHATIVGGVTSALAQIEGAFEMDAVPLPVGAEGRQGTCYSGNQHMISSATEHPEEAWELLKRYSSGEAGVSMVLDGKLQPNGHKSAWTDEKVNEVNRMFGITDALLTAGIEPFPMPKNTRFTEANDIFRNEIDLIWEGEVTWQEHAGVIEEKVKEVLDLDLPS